jgi:SAM-dependent methyltransferase
MAEYREETYGERIASIYDERYREVEGGLIDRLAELAGSGRALELGIGTGRVALPLAERGVEVHGIDASEAMVARLRAKPGGESIPVTLGDLAEVPVAGDYSLIYVVFNTFFALLTQEKQVHCFQSVAKHLTPEGFFLLEVFVPDLGRFDRGQTVRAVRIGLEEVDLDISRLDAVLQQITTQHVLLSERGVRLYPVKLRYAWPAELDLMGRLAGLRLMERWGDWVGNPFTGSSRRHISVYQKAG